MPATVTLSTTTLAAPVEEKARQIKVASTSGLTPGTHLFVGGELMSVVSLGVSPWVNVLRGVGGTASIHHDSSEVVWIGRGDQFYSQDPVGAPAEAVPVSPYINVKNGSVWFARGDALPVGQGTRWWQRQTSTPGTVALGVRTTTLDPTAST